MGVFCRVFFLIFIFLFASPVFGQYSGFEKQVYPSILLADENFEEAKRLGGLSSAEAIGAFEKLLQNYPFEENPKAHLAIQYLLGASHHPYDQQKALDIYLDALKQSELFPALHSRLLTRKAWAMAQLAHPDAVDAGKHAYTFTQKNEFPASEQLNAITHYFGALHRSNQLQKCHELIADYKNLLDACKSPDVKHTALSQLGRFYFETGMYQAANRAVEEDLKMCREAFGDTSLLTTNAYITVGIVASQVGDYEKEISYYEKAAEMLDFLIAKKQYHHYAVYINIGHAYTNKGAGEKAYPYYLSSKKILENITPKSDPERSDVYSSLAVYHAETGQKDSVVFYTDKVDAIFEDLNHGLKLQAFFKSANALSLVGMDKKAETFHGELIETIDADYVGKHFYKARVLLQRAEKEPNKKEKLNILNMALHSVHPNFAPDSLTDLPSQPNFTELTTARNVLLAKSRALSDLYSPEPTERELAVIWNHVELGIEVLNALFAEQQSAAATRTNATAREFYKIGLEALAQLHKSTGKEEYMDAAFELMQRSKGHLLEKYLHEKERLARLDQGLKTKIERLKEEGYLIGQQLSATGEKAELQSRRAEIEQELNDLYVKLEQENPAYYQFLEKPAQLGLDEVKDYLGKIRATYVEYFIQDRQIFAFVISGGDPGLHHWEVEPEMGKKTRELLSGMREFNAMEYAAKSHELYQHIFQPLEESLASGALLVVPDRWMAQLPLEILISELPDENALFNRLNYLIADYSFSYLYSADMLSRNLKNTTSPSLYLGIAPGFAGENNQIAEVVRSGSSQPALLGARNEVESAAKLFQQEVRTSDENLEDLLKEKGGDYSILHLATHAEIDEKSPLNSRIYLDEKKREDGEDGILHQYELFNIDLCNELTVLSACKTGSGPWIEGEGV
ncbi:MAG TPA: CHAT domain-containing tetratricopeptide repeat protein, partial [Cryomorphaceae bacterium]|nr:CHAT domain-containing tetratricopeptide repeat protein [Cryomorphaceae bacterium]